MLCRLFDLLLFSPILRGVFSPCLSFLSVLFCVILTVFLFISFSFYRTEGIFYFIRNFYEFFFLAKTAVI